MSKKFKVIIITSVVFILGLIFTTPNDKFKSKFTVSKIDISQNNSVKRYLDKNIDFEGIDIINNNPNQNKIDKYDEAYVIFKNTSDKYYNNVNLKETESGIMISYDEASFDDEYKNKLYNTRIDEVMVLRIKSNNSIENIEIVKN